MIEKRDHIQKLILDCVDMMLARIPEHESFIIDFWYGRDEDKLRLLKMNPFAPFVTLGAFDWKADYDTLETGPLGFRVLEQVVPANQVPVKYHWLPGGSIECQTKVREQLILHQRRRTVLKRVVGLLTLLALAGSVALAWCLR